MNTMQKGELAKLKVLLRAVELGLTVSIPTTTARYDLVIDYGDRLEKVQVKWAGRAPNRSTGAVEVLLKCENGNGTRRYRAVRYSKGEIDCVFAYVPQIDSVVRLPEEMVVNRSAVSLRLEPSKNGQQKGVHMVTDYIW